MRFPHRLQAVSEARRWLRADLQRDAPLLDPARLEETLLMASELVTNVVEHTECEPDVTVSQTDRSVRIEVRDDDPGRPVVQPLDPTRIGGNGMRIVDRWADTWGVERQPDDGKVVWFSVTNPGESRISPAPSTKAPR